MNWTQFPELASSTGYILLFTVLIWVGLACVMYWSYVSGTTSSSENVKFKIVEDDKPVSR